MKGSSECLALLGEVVAALAVPMPKEVIVEAQKRTAIFARARTTTVVVNREEI
jgi:hypothetical protein